MKEPWQSISPRRFREVLAECVLADSDMIGSDINLSRSGHATVFPPTSCPRRFREEVAECVLTVSDMIGSDINLSRSGHATVFLQHLVLADFARRCPGRMCPRSFRYDPFAAYAACNEGTLAD